MPLSPLDNIPSGLLTTTQMAEAERRAMAAGMPGIELMERAGAAVAEVAARRAGSEARIAVLCGPGNNGGDGFVAGRRLRARGYAVSIGLIGEVSALKGDAAEAARRWDGPVVPLAALDLAAADLAVDALFGAGLARDLAGAAADAVNTLNSWRQSTGRAVVAVDVPSGLDANTGAIRGVAVEADATVTFCRARPGHLLFPGRRLGGELTVAEIGISDAIVASVDGKNFVNSMALWRRLWPAPSLEGHKYSRGHALVVSGGPWSTGAARLAARGTLRSGAGLVTLASPRAALPVNASHLTAVMLAPCDDAGELAAILADRRFNAVALGPGLGVGAATRALVEAALAAPNRQAIVLDADALTSFETAPEGLKSAISASGKPVILTPHEGEFTRLFNPQRPYLESIPQPAESISEAPESVPATDKLTRAGRAAALTGAIVLLKGPDTVVAAPDGRASILADSTPWLATAGSGDVLAGIIAGLAAQGMPAFEAASAGAWMHAQAGLAAGPGLISEDLPETLRGVVARLAGTQ